jgi:hypothetical protein
MELRLKMSLPDQFLLVSNTLVKGSGGRARTYDQSVNSRSLYH